MGKKYIDLEKYVVVSQLLSRYTVSAAPSLLGNVFVHVVLCLGQDLRYLIISDRQIGAAVLLLPGLYTRFPTTSHSTVLSFKVGPEQGPVTPERYDTNSRTNSHFTVVAKMLSQA